MPSCLFGWVGASIGSKGRVGEAGSMPDISARATGLEHTGQKRGSNSDGSKMHFKISMPSLYGVAVLCVLEGKWALQSSKSMCGSYPSKSGCWSLNVIFPPCISVSSSRRVAQWSSLHSCCGSIFKAMLTKHLLSGRQ